MIVLRDVSCLRLLVSLLLCKHTHPHRFLACRFLACNLTIPFHHSITPQHGIIAVQHPSTSTHFLTRCTVVWPRVHCSRGGSWARKRLGRGRGSDVEVSGFGWGCWGESWVRGEVVMGGMGVMGWEGRRRVLGRVDHRICPESFNAGGRSGVWEGSGSMWNCFSEGTEP